MTILRLQNPAALDLPEVAGLLAEAFAKTPYKTPLASLRRAVEDDRVALLLHRTKGDWDGMAWVDAREWEEDNATTVLHFYSVGGPKVRGELVKAVVDFTKEVGADKILAWDMNNRPAAFKRAFRGAGKATEKMRMYEFNLEGGE